MALQVIEFFGYRPLDPAATSTVSAKFCPFIGNSCVKPNHGACSVQQVSDNGPIICCPNRMYAGNYQILTDIAQVAFGTGTVLLKPADIQARRAAGTITGNEVAVFGQHWGQELPLPRPKGVSSGETRKYYVDWILARMDTTGNLGSKPNQPLENVCTH